MKRNIHPVLNDVIFIDASTGDEIVTRSTMSSRERRTMNEKEYHVIKLDVTSYSHPFYTGKLRLVDSEGRVERFRRRYTNQLKAST